MLRRADEYELDFTLLPVIDYESYLLGLRREIEDRMERIGFLSETLNRARGAAMLFHKTNGELENWRNEAFIIGGLCNFVSMEEALTRDLKKSPGPLSMVTIKDSKNPLLHLMDLLRDVNIHATSFTLSPQSITLINQAPEPLKFTKSVVLIADLNVQQLHRKQEAQRQYDQQDLGRIVNWFNEKQEIYGASHLLVKGVGVFCSEIISHCA